jgi:DNA-binding beta-propeller fold protein YncE
LERWACEVKNHRIQVFDSDGEFLRKWGTEGTGNGQFNGAAGISIGPDGLLYICDENNYRIQVFTSDGKFVCKWGEKGSGDGQLEMTVSFTL